MRTPIAFILAAIACAMLAAAGCTGTPATTPATPAETTAATVADTPAPETTTAVPAGTTDAGIPSWTGTWNTSYSVKDSADVVEIIEMAQNGTSVTGTYNNGLGTIESTVQDAAITGTWHDSDNAGEYSGFFVFERSANGTTFTGKWVSTSEGADALKNTTQYWNGVRA